eukprot:1142268-Pelagomonas_calceolata.AAC.1
MEGIKDLVLLMYAVFHPNCIHLSCEPLQLELISTAGKGSRPYHYPWPYTLRCTQNNVISACAHLAHGPIHKPPAGRKLERSNDLSAGLQAAKEGRCHDIVDLRATSKRFGSTSEGCASLLGAPEGRPCFSLHDASP